MGEQQWEVEDTIEDISLFLPKLIRATESVQEQLVEPITDQFWEQFSDIVEGMDDLYRTLSSIQEVLENKQGFQALYQVCERTTKDLSVKFQEMNTQMDQEDYIGANDCLRYELIPLFHQLSLELGQEGSRINQEQLLAANLQFLGKKYPEVFRKMNVLHRDENNYEFMNSRNGQPNLFVTAKDGKAIYLYSKYSPEYEMENWLKHIALKVEQKNEIIFYGMGYGYHALAYAEQNPNHNIYIYEPDEQILLSAMYNIDLKQLLSLPNVKHLSVSGNINDRAKMIYRFMKYMKGDAEIIVLPVYNKLSSNNVLEFSNEVKLAILNYGSSYVMYEKHGLEWFENSMYNLPQTLYSPSLAEMKNKFIDKIAVIVGAGPSLAEDIEHLRQLKKHAIIIAAGSAVQSLIHYNIRPHLIVSMDGAESNFNVFRNTDVTGIPLLYAPMIKYKILDYKRDNLFHVHFENDFITKFFFQLSDQDATFLSNHSVTGTAIQAAVYMGCKEVIFTGQDLSYPTENMYAPGSQHVSEQHMEKTIAEADLVVENVQGTLNRTNKIMKLVLEDICELLEKYLDIKFVNTSRKGARIRNASFEPMEQVLQRSLDKYVADDFMNQELQKLKGYDLVRIQRISKSLLQLPKQITEFEQQLKRIEKNIKLCVEWSRTNPAKSIKAINAIDNDWGDVVAGAPFHAFCYMLLRNQINRFERDLPELVNETDVMKKSDLVKEIMYPLIVALIEKVPVLREVTGKTIEKLNNMKRTE